MERRDGWSHNPHTAKSSRLAGQRGSMSNLRGIIVLGVTTWAFVVCFAVWLMFGVIGIPIGKELGLNGLEFGLLTSTPVLTGALFRLPLGIWTDRFGGRIVMFALLVGCAVPVWFASYANQLWQFLLLGLALGVVGVLTEIKAIFLFVSFASSRDVRPVGWTARRRSSFNRVRSLIGNAVTS